MPPAFQIYLADEPALDLPDGPRSAGAYHSGDLVYVFNNLDRFAVDWTAEDRKIADAMTGYWTEFAKTGTQIVQIYRLGHSMACNNTKP